MFLARETFVHSVDGLEMPKPKRPTEFFIRKTAFPISFTRPLLNKP